MKNIILTAILLIASFTVFSQKGVNFEDLTFNEALAKAKAENKLVFMDCCHEMVRGLYPDCKKPVPTRKCRKAFKRKLHLPQIRYGERRRTGIR